MDRTRKLIAGNWKMHGGLAANAALVDALLADAALPVSARVAVAVPAPYLAQLQPLLADGRIALAAQDVSAAESGAFTGEVAAAMLRALGIASVRLLTNNPAKVSGLEAAGLRVTERVRHHMPVNPDNADYIETKRSKSGHLD